MLIEESVKPTKSWGPIINYNKCFVASVLLRKQQ